MVHFTVISALFTPDMFQISKITSQSSSHILLRFNYMSDRRCVLHSLVSMHKDSIGYEIQNVYPRYFAASDTEPSTAKIRSNRDCIPCS